MNFLQPPQEQSKDERIHQLKGSSLHSIAFLDVVSTVCSSMTLGQQFNSQAVMLGDLPAIRLFNHLLMELETSLVVGNQHLRGQ